MPHDTVIEISQQGDAHHARKQHNVKRTRKDGVRLLKRNGQVAYLEYHAPFGVIYFPSIEGAAEQIECRTGGSAITVEGRNLWSLCEDLQAKLCDTIQESENLSDVPYIERITVRLWL